MARAISELQQLFIAGPGNADPDKEGDADACQKKHEGEHQDHEEAVFADDNAAEQGNQRQDAQADADDITSGYRCPGKPPGVLLPYR